ncbi:MAG: ATP-binding cassette domain-containing protein [Clostridia bacterium]|nr:ATP-binding cassette domain-containing protein [Clostridia bacterium]
MEEISIKGARIHNLKNIDLTIPKHKLIVITGISGSGKSSLAFDLLFEEGKNQYLRSIGILTGFYQEERFDYIKGMGPAVAIRQNTIRQSNIRSTVGSKTAVLNLLALLCTSDGVYEDQESPFSTERPHPGELLYTTADGMCMNCQGRGSYYEINLEKLIPDQTMTLEEVYEMLHVTKGYFRILQKKYGDYFCIAFWKLPEEVREEIVYGTYENGKQSYCIERILSTAFDRGEDVESVYVKTICSECHGERVSEKAGSLLLHGRRIGELALMTLTKLSAFLNELSDHELSQFGRNIRDELVKKINHLIQFRLGHLTLYREMSTLSGGEVQRIFLHMHLESGLDSLVYIFDEPMSGLHVSEKQSMIDAVKELRDMGNTVIVVEHDPLMMRHADHIIEIGEGAGVNGGSISYQGDYAGYLSAETRLSTYLKNEPAYPDHHFVRKDEYLFLTHANVHYLKDLSVKFPLHALVGIAGLSGSGKSSLIEETLLKRLLSAKKYGTADGIEGVDLIDGFVKISQEPIGRSINSTPASYIGIWDKIRELFSRQEESVREKMDAGYFSLHSKGACKSCGGSGYDRIYLTADFSVDKVCPECRGNRFNAKSLSVYYRGKNIDDILKMSMSQAAEFFADQPNIVKPIRILERMGMGYLTLGQPTSTLSGGEAQRVKLAKALGRRGTGNRLYVLDEPTTGLSMYDTALLLNMLKQLVWEGNSVIVIEHHMTILKNCDYLIELGPMGGEKGGEIIACGTIDDLIHNKQSVTGRYLS